MIPRGAGTGWSALVWPGLWSECGPNVVRRPPPCAATSEGFGSAARLDAPVLQRHCSDHEEVQFALCAATRTPDTD